MSIKRLSGAGLTTPKSNKLWDQTTFQSGMFALASVKLTSSSASVTFSGIPTGYRNLQIRGNVRCTRAGTGYDWFTARLNGDTGNNYSFHIFMGQGSAPYVYGAGSQASFYVGGVSQASVASQISGAFVMDILDYAPTSAKNKTIKTQYGHEMGAANTESHTGIITGTWYNTADAVNSVTFILPAGGSFDTNSTFYLYGIK